MGGRSVAKGEADGGERARWPKGSAPWTFFTPRGPIREGGRKKASKGANGGRGRGHPRGHQHFGRAAALRIPEFVPDEAVWPRAWSRFGLPSAPAPAPAPPALLLAPAPPPQDGLLRDEAGWAQSAAEPDSDPDAHPGDIDRVPPWLDLSAAHPPRVGVRARVAAQQQLALSLPAGPPPPAPGFAQVWRRLTDRTLDRPHSITCWLILHSSLGCNAYLRHVYRKSSISPFCDAPVCAAAGSLETLTHTFLECLEVSP